MAASLYDVNVQLALATTAEHEGDLHAARAFLMEARRASGTDRRALAQVRAFFAGLVRRRVVAAVDAAQVRTVRTMHSYFG
jgi:hypothetical protein